MAAVKKFSGVALAVAAAGLLLSGAVSAHEGEMHKADEAKVKCSGVNSCKGQTECKSASNDCKGQNSCKGKGFMKMSTEECAAKKGTVLQEKS